MINLDTLAPLGFALVLIAAFIIIFIFYFFYRLFGTGRSAAGKPGAWGLYERRSVMTNAERDFFRVVEKVVGDKYYLFPQVRLNSLVEFKKDYFERKAFFSLINKSVDYVICDKSSLKTLLVIELDDFSHQNDERKKRDRYLDEVFGSAGVSIIHVVCRRTYDFREIEKQITSFLGK